MDCSLPRCSVPGISLARILEWVAISFSWVHIYILHIHIYMYIYIEMHIYCIQGFPGGSVVKNLPANAGASGVMGLIPGLRRSPGVGNGNSLQYSCLENPMDRGAWWAVVSGVTKSQTPLSYSAQQRVYLIYNVVSVQVSSKLIH